MAKKGKKSIKIFVVFSVVFSFCAIGLVAGLSSDFIGVDIKTNYGVNLTGNVSNVAEATACMGVLIENYNAINEGSVEKYIQTVDPSKAESTREEITKFFTDYKLENSLQQFKIIEQTENSLDVEAAQKSILITASPGADEYKNHISTINYSFTKINGQWYISSSEITDNYFI